MVTPEEFFVSSPKGLSLTEGRPRSPHIHALVLGGILKDDKLTGRIPPTLPNFYRCHRTTIPGKTIGCITQAGSHPPGTYRPVSVLES